MVALPENELTLFINSFSRAVVKLSSKEKILDALKHEHACYTTPAIHLSRHIQTIYNAINMQTSPENENPFCLTFAWIDCTLKNMDTQSHNGDPAFYKSIASAVLGALAELKSQQLFHIGTPIQFRYLSARTD
jgi:hypothetical protein